MLTFFLTILITTSVTVLPTTEASVSEHYAFSKKWGTLGTGAGNFKNPAGVVVSPSGVIYVADTGNNRIQMFKLASPCPRGTVQIVSGVCYVKAWGTFGSANGQFKSPSDLALDSSGHLIVVDIGNNRIQMFSGNGAFVKTWNTDGAGTAQFVSIMGVATDTSTNDIYLAVAGAPIPEEPGQWIPGSLHKFRIASPCPSSTTEVIPGICFIARWEYGLHNSPPQTREKLAGVAVNSTTHEVYVSDYEDFQHPPSHPDVYRIIKKTGNGGYLGEWGSTGSGDGQFSFPSALAVDPSGRVYVADTGNNRIQMFQIQRFQVSIPCPAGTVLIKFGVCFVTKWGSFGSGNGQFNLPHDVTIGPLGRVYVADTGNNRIQEFYWKTHVTGVGGGGTQAGIAVK